MHAPPYRHYGQPLEECTAWLDAHAKKYDAIGLCMGQCNVYETGVALAKHIQTLHVPLVIGGPYASTAPVEAMERTGAGMVWHHR